MMEILKLEKDMRRDSNNKRVVLFSPIGSLAEFKPFQENMQRLNIDKTEEVDFLFVVRKGIEQDIMNECKLSAIIYSENMIKLGTSGAFFAGQVKSYDLGYEYTIVTDCDVELPERSTFDGILALARETGKCVAPLISPRTTMEKATDSNVAGYGVYPRSIFEKYGFAVPYFYRGSEDADQNIRVNPDKLTYTKGNIYHPIKGVVVYHGTQYPKLYFQYLNAALKMYLLHGKYMKFCAFYIYFNFFADIFRLKRLRDAIQTGHRFDLIWENISNRPYNIVRIEKIKDKATMPSIKEMKSAIFQALPNFLMGKPFDVYTDRIYLNIPRWELLLGISVALLLLPIRAVELIFNLIEWKIMPAKGIIYPVMHKDVNNVEAWMLAHFPRND